MTLFNGFYLDAKRYKEQASSIEFAHTKARMYYYCTKNSIPFFDQKDQLNETFYPTNTIYFLKHAAQLIFGVAVFVKTLFTDIRSLPDVFFGMACLGLAMILDVLNVIASSVSCLLKIAPTINQGYTVKNNQDTSEHADDNNTENDDLKSYTSDEDESEEELGLFDLSHSR